MPGSVLIIEDDRFSQRIMQETLKSKGFTAFTADNGQEAIEVLEANPEIRVCLLDLNMPVLDGYGFLKHITNVPDYKFLNVYITSCNDREYFFNMAKLGNIDTNLVKGYYEKPFDFFKLIDKINEVM
jgi:two-component system, chemotaxis family, chemotaxis protein CheY